MKVKNSAQGQTDIMAILQNIMPELAEEEVDVAKTYAQELVELSRMRKIAKTGWRPDTLNNKGKPNKFGIYRNCVYYVTFPPVVGSEQELVRPAVVVRPSGGNTIIVIPLTDEQYGNNLFFNVDLAKPFDPAVPHSTALVEQIRVIDKRRVSSPYRVTGNIARVDDDDILKIHDALAQLLKMDLDKIKVLQGK